ncbi:CRAL-TRIO domain-containing protein [Xylaria palmicola]|nr:CRAL-TRIO domain-containing protein [Xylaria palmicola]
MTVELGDPGTLGNLTPDEERKLQEAWIHLLRLCGVENLGDAGRPGSAPDLTDELRRAHAGGLLAEAFREGLWGFVLSEHPDALALRFLRARKWDAARAVAMLASAVAWRAERDVAGAVIRRGEDVALRPAGDRSADDEGFLAQYRSGKSFVRGADRAGRPVYTIRVCLHDPRLQSAAAMEAYTLHNIESLRVFARPGRDKFCLVFDMTGFGLRNMDFHVVKFLVSVFEARYPETLGVILIHNAPFVFWGIWNMIKGWLDPVIASKINFTRRTADLLQFIPEEHVPARHGGKDAWEYAYVEPVPGENARLGEAEKRTEIQSERGQLISEFELETVEWVAADAAADAAGESAARRTEVAERLSENYWRLDPYIRAKTHIHRLGLAELN